MCEQSQGFSDDNAHGSLLSGTVITPEDGAVLSMNEIAAVEEREGARRLRGRGTEEGCPR